MRYLCLLIYIITSLSLPDMPLTDAQNDPQSANKLGVHLLLDDGRGQWSVTVWDAHLAAARESVGAQGYITQLIRLDDLNPKRWQYFMDLCAQYDLIPIIRLATTYDHAQDWWIAPPMEADGSYRTVATAYAKFLASLTWPTAEHLIIVGNEPNHGNEWGGTPNPTEYAQFLADVADKIHANDAQSVVLNAGFDHYAPHTNGQMLGEAGNFMDAESFMDEMLVAQPDIFTKIDAWASHPYPLGAFSQPPWEQAFQIDYLFGASNPHHLAPPTDMVNRGVNGYAWELYKLASYGVTDLPVYITETGWRYRLDDTEENGLNYPTPSQVIAYLDLTLYGNQGRYPDLPNTGWTPWLADERVVAVTFFALDGHSDDWNHTTWLVMDEDGMPAETIIHIPK